MKKILSIALISILFSCSSKEDKLIEIIDKTDQHVDFFHMKLPYFYLEPHSKFYKDEEYYLARLIYDEGFKRERHFYIINLTRKEIVLSSREYDSFFKPIATKMLGNAMTDLSGDIYMQSLRKSSK